MQRAKEMNEIFCPIGFSEERKDHEFPLAEELEVIFISVNRTQRLFPPSSALTSSWFLRVQRDHHILSVLYS